MQRITFITFGVFMVEAIVHYNIGAKAATRNANVDNPVVSPSKFGVPPTKDLLRMAIWVFVFSFISAKLIKNK
jgi:hypothetical protein